MLISVSDSVKFPGLPVSVNLLSVPPNLNPFVTRL
jgi:hypothetical protein